MIRALAWNQKIEVHIFRVNLGCVEGVKVIKEVIRGKYLLTTYRHTPPKPCTCALEHRSGPTRWKLSIWLFTAI